MKLNNNTIKIWDLGFGNPPIGVGLEEVDKDPVTGEWRTDDFAVPYGDGIEKTLDETLDRAYIEVINDKREDPYEPFTPVYAYGLYWFVADDVSTFKKIVGRDKMFNHQITLTEPTKWLERFMVGTKTVTQPVNKNYDTSESDVVPYCYNYDYGTGKGNNNENVFGGMNGYTSPVLLTENGMQNGMEVLVWKIQSVLDYANAEENEDRPLVGNVQYKVSASLNGKKILDSQQLKIRGESVINTGGVPTENQKIIIKEAGKLDIFYSVETFLLDPNGKREMVETQKKIFSIAIISQSQAEDKDLLSVAEDVLQCAETLQKDEPPRFILSNSAKDKLRGVISPEFTFTSATLRESLDQISKYVGCITRLTVYPYAENRYIIDLDEFDIGTTAKMPKGDPDGITSSQSINQYASALDSVVENIVVHSAGGAIAEPGIDSYRTLRTESASYRVSEGTGVIFTDFPIERLDKVEVCTSDGDPSNPIDITSYVFEASEYGTLSSYTEAYPYSKSYALCYSLGGKNITGLNFEVDTAAFKILKHPAIVNIINKASGSSFTKIDFTELLFRVTYVPVVSARIRARKGGIKTESVINSNQASAKIDANAYGRALKGEILRIGNIEKILHYASVMYDTDLPECGQMFDDNYYISSIKTQSYADKMDVDISLSKDFNRLSSYIGVRQNLRIEEISKSLAYDRYIIYEDTIIVTTDATRKGSGNTLCGGNIFDRIMIPFLRGKTTKRRQYSAFCDFFVDGGISYKRYRLPVYSFGCGNSLVFTFAPKDNYSAGVNIDDKSIWAEFSNTGGLDAFYQLQSENRYTDLFGKFDMLGFEILEQSEILAQTTDYEEKRNEADLLPITTSNSLSGLLVRAYKDEDTGIDTRLVIKKDTRENPKVTYQANFIGEKGVIIYSNMAELLLLPSSKAKLIYLENRISGMREKIPEGLNSEAVDVVAELVMVDESIEGMTVTASKSADKKYSAWCVLNGEGKIIFGANQVVESGGKAVAYFIPERK